jgi:hypothetical protein
VFLLQLHERQLNLGLLVLAERVPLLGHGDGGPVEVAHSASGFLVGDAGNFDAPCSFPGGFPLRAVAGVAVVVGLCEAEHKVFGDELAGFLGCERPFLSKVRNLDVSVGLGYCVLLWCLCVHLSGLVLRASRLLWVVLQSTRWLRAHIDDTGALLGHIAGRRRRRRRPVSSRRAWPPLRLLRLGLLNGDKAWAGHCGLSKGTGKWTW